ncbi:MAG: hypothetical protein WCS42_24915 [Verrucomicrobiota bacterium]
MKAVLNLKNANAEEVLRVGKNVLKGYTDNATVFTNPKPSVASFGAHTADLDAKIGAVKTAEEAHKAAVIARDTATAVVLADLNVALPYVQETSAGDPLIIAKANLDTKSPSLPVGKLPQVQNLSLTIGDTPGAVDGHWDAVAGRKSYEHAHCTADPAVEANWKMVGSSSASKTSFVNHTSGTRLWARVRAKGTKPENDGAWSQPATIIIP